MTIGRIDTPPTLTRRATGTRQADNLKNHSDYTNFQPRGRTERLILEVTWHIPTQEKSVLHSRFAKMRQKSIKFLALFSAGIWVLLQKTRRTLPLLPAAMNGIPTLQSIDLLDSFLSTLFEAHYPHEGAMCQ